MQIITSKDADGVDNIRHSCAHLVGQAIKKLYPTARTVITVLCWFQAVGIRSAPPNYVRVQARQIW